MRQAYDYWQDQPGSLGKEHTKRVANPGMKHKRHAQEAKNTQSDWGKLQLHAPPWASRWCAFSSSEPKRLTRHLLENPRRLAARRSTKMAEHPASGGASQSDRCTTAQSRDNRCTITQNKRPLECTPSLSDAGASRRSHSTAQTPAGTQTSRGAR